MMLQLPAESMHLDTSGKGRDVFPPSIVINYNDTGCSNYNCIKVERSCLEVTLAESAGL